MIEPVTGEIDGPVFRDQGQRNVAAARSSTAYRRVQTRNVALAK
jgi:hypothetical protein